MSYPHRNVGRKIKHQGIKASEKDKAMSFPRKNLGHKIKYQRIEASEKDKAMSRPRRNIGRKSYVDPTSSDDEGVEDEDKSDEMASDYSGSEVGTSGYASASVAPATQEKIPNPASPKPELPALLALSLPTDSQVAQTRALIEEQAAEVSRIEGEYNKQKTIMDALEKRLQNATRELFNNRALIAPIRRLPLEILGIIFEFHVRQYKQSPWTLMQVSRMWRNAAMLQRSLWSSLTLTTRRKKGDGPRTRSEEGKEVCVVEDHIEKALLKAGSAPLNITVVVKGRSGHRYSPYFSSHNYSNDKFLLSKLITHITDTQPGTRLRSLELDTVQHFHLPDNFGQFNLRGLQLLRVDSQYPNLINQAAKEAQNLRYFYYRAVDINPLQNRTWWPDLVELAIESRLTEEGNVPLLRSILIASKSLTSLYLRDVHIPEPSIPKDRIVLPNLKRLSLISVRGFWPIDCPNITHLVLQDPSTPEEFTGKASIRLSRLIEATFISRNIGNFMVFDLPSLQTLELNGQGVSKTYVAQALQDMFPIRGGQEAPPNIAPISLHLREMKINPKILTKVLQRSTGLEELVLESTEVNVEFLDSLGPWLTTATLTPSDVTNGSGRGKGKGSASANGKPKKNGQNKAQKWSVVCPTLKKLKIDLRGSKKTDEQTWKEAASKVVTERAEAGFMFEEASIRFTEEGGWQPMAGVADSTDST